MHEGGQKIVRVDYAELSAPNCSVYIHPLGFYPWAKNVPVSDSRNQNDALAIRQRRGSEPADGAIQKLLVLVKLDNVIVRRCIGQKTAPRLIGTGGVAGRLRQAVWAADIEGGSGIGAMLFHIDRSGLE
jgi:hypothetical protein